MVGTLACQQSTYVVLQKDKYHYYLWKKEIKYGKLNYICCKIMIIQHIDIIFTAHSSACSKYVFPTEVGPTDNFWKTLGYKSH